jgi:thiol-disulfide isomerase/thioredoxin
VNVAIAFARGLSWLLIGCLVAAPAMAAPDFELPDLKGRIHRLTDYRGQWVVVNYWATWCPPCLQEMPELMWFHEQYADQGVTVLGLDLEDIDVETLSDFVAGLSVEYPILLAGITPPEDMPAILGLPMTFVISPEGEIMNRHLGPVTAAMLENMLLESGAKLEWKK